MPTNCILPAQAEKLRKAFRTGELSMTKLFSLSSAGRVSLLEEYVGEGAKTAVAKIEKAYLAPNQKLAMRNTIFQMFGEKPLYKGVTLKQADKMSEGLKMSELKTMSPEKRIESLSNFVDDVQAKKLNDRFEHLKQTGNLKIWEEKTLGTESLRTNAKLKGSLAKLEVIDDLGILTPKKVEDFMQTFVESKLNADITLEESNQLSELIKIERDLFDKIEASGDWTGENYQDNLDYRIAVDKLNKFTNKLQEEKSVVEFGNELVEIARNNILGTIFSGINSALYQVIPTIERIATKRLTPATLKMDATLMDKISTKISSGLFADKEGRQFIKSQLKLGLDVYDKTSMDISRTINLNDGYSFFGEKERRGALPISTIKKSFKEDVIKPIKDAKGIKAKIFAGTSGYAEITSNFPKWMAGGTDTIIANTTRAETAVLWSSEIASLESKTNKLPKNVTQKERAKQLLKDSYNPTAIDEKAIMIREQAILDAHYSNNTQPDSMADLATGLRDKLGYKKFKFGKVIIPFIRITTTTLSRGLQSAIGYGPLNVGVAKELFRLNKAFKNVDEIEGIMKANKAIANLIGYIGIPMVAMIIAALLDEDDYVAPYAALSYKEYKQAEAKGARPSSIRIGGKWIPIKYLPMISIPIASIMMARQAKEKGTSVVWGYAKGMVAQVLETPIISSVGKLYEKGKKSIKKDELDEVSETTGLNFQDIWDYTKIRMIPSMISRDLYNAALPKTKFNFLGEEVEGGKIFRDDKTNAILLEFEELNKTGNMPVISDPTSEDAKKLKAELGTNQYQRFLAELKRSYAEKILEKINSIHWDNKSPEDKKKSIDYTRKVKILDKL